MPTPITAAILVIGDEILSGRTKDKNIGTIADVLNGLGIDLSEVRIVPDVEDEIVAAVNALRRRYTYLFTTGGIGPTHDDITADSVAKAFGVPIGEDPRAIEMLLQRIKPEDLNEARRRMARIPEGADLVRNDISKAPGFMLGNVIVMAGVPAIMQNMLDNVVGRLEGGARMIAAPRSTRPGFPEGAYAAGLGALAKLHADVSIGSYPSFTPEGFRNQIVVRGKEPGVVETARAAVVEMLVTLRGDEVPV